MCGCLDNLAKKRISPTEELLHNHSLSALAVYCQSHYLCEIFFPLTIEHVYVIFGISMKIETKHDVIYA